MCSSCGERCVILRKTVICARAKELQFEKGVKYISEYCKHYDTTLDMNVNNHELSGEGSCD